MLTYMKKNFDEISILALFATLQFESSPILTADENNILLALTRSTNDLNSNSTIEDIQDYLSQYSTESLEGIANNVKGILHEIEYIELENSDNDGIYASMFEETNHQGYDIQFFDDTNSLIGEAQLKATDNVSYVKEWMEKNDGEILITEELADKMGIASSGISNEELTVKTQEFINKIVDEDSGEELISYVPYLSAMSISMVIYELWKRYQDGQMSYSKFKTLSMQATGYKVVKISAIAILMSIPVLNVATTIVLLSQLLLNLSGNQSIKKSVVDIDELKKLSFKRI